MRPSYAPNFQKFRIRFFQILIGIGFVSICWEHFKPEDYLLKLDPKYVFENGMGSLKQSAVPSQNLPSENFEKCAKIHPSNDFIKTEVQNEMLNKGDFFWKKKQQG